MSITLTQGGTNLRFTVSDHILLNSEFNFQLYYSDISFNTPSGQNVSSSFYTLEGTVDTSSLPGGLQIGSYYALTATDGSTTFVSNIVQYSYSPPPSIILTQNGTTVSFTTNFTALLGYRIGVRNTVFRVYSWAVDPYSDPDAEYQEFTFTLSDVGLTDATPQTVTFPNQYLQPNYWYSIVAYDASPALVQSNILKYDPNATPTTITTTTRVPTPRIITQADVSGIVLLTGKYTLGENITVTKPISAANGTIFDGSGHTLTIISDAWLGLFFSCVTVMNLDVSGTPSVAEFAGLLFATDVSGIAYNCVNRCPTGFYGGGIFGGYSSGLAISCHNSGNMPNAGGGGGGIFGAHSSGTAVGCTNSGNVTHSSGGIFGISLSSSVTAINCSNSGTFIPGSFRVNMGGIFAPGSSGTAINCFNTASLLSDCGGIFGQRCSGTATNCYNTGSFSGELAGGIFGWDSSGTAHHCYNVGHNSNNSNSITGATAFHHVNNIPSVTAQITSSASGSTTSWSDVGANLFLLGVSGEVWVPSATQTGANQSLTGAVLVPSATQTGANQYLTDGSGNPLSVLFTGTPYTLSPFHTSIKGLLALFEGLPQPIPLAKSMDISDSEIAFATVMNAQNDTTKYGALSQLTTYTFTYTPANAAIFYKHRNLDLSGNLNIIVPV